MKIPVSVAYRDFLCHCINALPACVKIKNQDDMKAFKPNLFLMAACLAAVVLSACRKDQNNGCAVLYSTSVVEPVVAMQIVDKQNRDLFDASTPNHYDSLTVAQLNNNRVHVVKYQGTHLLIMYYLNGENTTIYSLSNTDQDTVYTKTQTVKNECSSYQKLVAFKYNGQSYTDTLSTGRFVIVK